MVDICFLIYICMARRTDGIHTDGMVGSIVLGDILGLIAYTQQPEEGMMRYSVQLSSSLQSAIVARA